ncbi:NIPSNAP family protein [Paenibacillus lignilyticus]|uniref:NIPSNAP family protein n=1 Tax=Paenibacillus lignilyticus TaxID=1172615 RepID=A0ABS5CDL0_9BACL|nr:NIPSNAP family protein [Paenibacillus lignilyticus]MBP3963208.1 NIPSNAP family protein [Paenibacillus lignilyticus]
MLYELRVYHVMPGKMQAIQARFRDHVIELFSKHGMKITHFWDDVDTDKNQLYYIVEHENMELREANYERFRNDPEWLELRRVTEADGALVEKQESIYMKNVPFFKNN